MGVGGKDTGLLVFSFKNDMILILLWLFRIHSTDKDVWKTLSDGGWGGGVRRGEAVQCGRHGWWLRWCVILSSIKGNFSILPLQTHTHTQTQAQSTHRAQEEVCLLQRERWNVSLFMVLLQSEWRCVFFLFVRDCLWVGGRGDFTAHGLYYNSQPEWDTGWMRFVMFLVAAI